jgi:hypothetical protein
MLDYIVIPGDRAVVPESTFAETVRGGTGAELAASLVAALDSIRYTVADSENGNIIEALDKAGFSSCQINVQPHRALLMGSPGIILTPLPIESTWRVTESTCLDVADHVMDLARLLSTKHGLSVAVALTSQLGWALTYSLA